MIGEILLLRLVHVATEPDETRARVTAELERLQRRATTGSLINTILLVLAAAGMAVARYLT